MSRSNQEQIELWNGRVGAKWALLQQNLDDMLERANAELIARAGDVHGLRILDIGCGTGVTCAAWLSGGAVVTGVDVSEPMLAAAQQRCNGKARLIRADAAEWNSNQPFDLAVSQFGVMFFDAPESAFKNIALNLRKGGRLLFICWRTVQENQWASAPMQAVHDLLPPADAPLPHAPGPFALGDRERVTTILRNAGFSSIHVQPFDFPVCMARQGGAEAALRFVMQIGPTSVALAPAGDAVKHAASDRLRTLLAKHDTGGLVTLGGAAWIIDAQI